MHLLGRRVAGRYEVIEPIGAGGMGTVYAAIDLETRREVAIKALNPRALTGENLKRFRREAATAAAVRHPTVCQVEHVGLELGAPFIVMEKLEGESLARRLRDTGRLPVADAIGITLQLLEALDAVHQHGIVHRDVKPGNVFLTSPRGAPPTVKLVDFGLAKTMPKVRLRNLRPAAQETTSVTRTNVVPGTVHYLSPEQLGGARDLDERVDVWAAGITLYEMLAGHRPFLGDALEVLAPQIALSDPAPLSATRADVPREIDDVLTVALAKDRARRFPSAASFHNALASVWAAHRAAGVARGARLFLDAHRSAASALGASRASEPRNASDAARDSDEVTGVSVDVHVDA